MDDALILITDRGSIRPEDVRGLLEHSYWAKERTVETIARAMENSLCYGLYSENELIGFGRAVTDMATMYWICDIIVAPAHRGKGYGKRIMEAISSTPELKNLLGILATADAHGLYEQYGFIRNAEKFMMKPRIIVSSK